VRGRSLSHGGGGRSAARVALAGWGRRVAGACEWCVMFIHVCSRRAAAVLPELADAASSPKPLMLATTARDTEAQPRLARRGMLGVMNDVMPCRCYTCARKRATVCRSCSVL